MGNTFFYNKAKKKPETISWRDILSESFKKHKKEDVEYVLTVGTSMNTATEDNMLKKWHKPWVWFQMLKAGIALILLLYILDIVLLTQAGSLSGSLLRMTAIIPPLIMPLVLAVFIWEMNIPGNISVIDLLTYWLIGGILSFAVTTLLFSVVPDSLPASYAAFREEPAKLAAVLILMAITCRKKKIYGITGLVVGAAVGAGFAGFESVSYAFNALESGGIISLIMNQILRSIWAICGHVFFCGFYSGMLALNMKEHRFNLAGILDAKFILSFFLSVGMHFLWNSSFVQASSFSFLIEIVFAGACVYGYLYILRKCMHQVISKGKYKSGDGYIGFKEEKHSAAAEIIVTCIAGSMKGSVWKGSAGCPLFIGRAQGNQVCLPSDMGGISRQHCRIHYDGRRWVLTDLNSSYGTYIQGAGKLTPGSGHFLVSGDIFYLASKQQAFRITIQ